MKILVLGGNGFVGKNLFELMKNTGHELITLSRNDGLDLASYSSTQKCFITVKPDVIINLAAVTGSLKYITERAAQVVDLNMRILLNIFRAITETKKSIVLINPIANCAFPGDINLYREEDFWSGKIHSSVLSYGSTRRMIDVLSTCYQMQHNLKIINFFVPNMYGPFETTDPNKAHALGALISKLLKAKIENIPTVEVWGTGIPIREWLFVKDYVRILNLVIEDINEFRINESINIGQNFGLSIRELVGIIIKKTDFKGKILWKTEMPDGAPVKLMDERKFKKYFPNFIFTSLEQGIEETIKYYHSVYPY